MQQNIFREYDIRGEVGVNLFEKDAYDIARAFAKKLCLKEQVVVVGRDGRLSSPEIHANLLEGLKIAGVKVIDVGVVPSPALYFAKYYLKAEAGIMITGSHNPKHHNGFKFITNIPNFYGAEIKSIYEEISSLDNNVHNGTYEEFNIEKLYVQAICENYNLQAMKVIWDPGNGAAGNIVRLLAAELPGEHLVLNAEIDGNFPNHHPDPSNPKNMKQLQETVLSEKADLGIAFDGDGDRLGVVDKNGNLIEMDQLLAVFAADLAKRVPGVKIVFDVKASNSLFKFVNEHAAEAVMWKTGHSLIKAKMLEIDALMAGEISGHIFFRDNYFGYDDAIFAAIRLLDIISNLRVETLTPLPFTFNTSEERIECSEEAKFAIVTKIQQDLRAQSINFNDIDGIRKTVGNGWWLLRASNTQNVLVTRCEADSKEALAVVREDLKQTLCKHL